MSSERGTDVKTMLDRLQSHAPFDRVEGWFGDSKEEIRIKELFEELLQTEAQIKSQSERIRSRMRRKHHVEHTKQKTKRFHPRLEITDDYITPIGWSIEGRSSYWKTIGPLLVVWNIQCQTGPRQHGSTEFHHS